MLANSANSFSTTANGYFAGAQSASKIEKSGSEKLTARSNVETGDNGRAETQKEASQKSESQKIGFDKVLNSQQAQKTSNMRAYQSRQNMRAAGLAADQRKMDDRAASIKAAADPKLAAQEVVPEASEAVIETNVGNSQSGQDNVDATSSPIQATNQANGENPAQKAVTKDAAPKNMASQDNGDDAGQISLSTSSDAYAPNGDNGAGRATAGKKLAVAPRTAAPTDPNASAVLVNASPLLVIAAKLGGTMTGEITDAGINSQNGAAPIATNNREVTANGNELAADADFMAGQQNRAVPTGGDKIPLAMGLSMFGEAKISATTTGAKATIGLTGAGSTGAGPTGAGPTIIGQTGTGPSISSDGASTAQATPSNNGAHGQHKACSNIAPAGNGAASQILAQTGAIGVNNIGATIEAGKITAENGISIAAASKSAASELTAVNGATDIASENIGQNIGQNNGQLSPARAETNGQAAPQTAAQTNQNPAAQSAQHYAHVDQLAAMMVRRFDGGRNEFRVRLDPPELGAIDVKLKIGADQTVTAQIDADKIGSLALLERARPQLEQALSDAGLKLAQDGLSFGGKQSEFSNQSGMGGNKANQGQQAGRNGQLNQSNDDLANGQAAQSVNTSINQTGTAGPKRGTSHDIWQRARLSVRA